MKPFRIKPVFIFFLLFFPLLLVFSGCNDSSSKKIEKIQKESSKLVGTWQQIALGEKEVSGFVVKMIFSDRTMTMDAPGCLIIGDYTTADNILTFTITSTQGERCATNQNTGKSDNVNYEVTDEQLILTPLLGGKETQAVYKRISDL